MSTSSFPGLDLEDDLGFEGLGEEDLLREDLEVAEVVAAIFGL